VTETRLITWDQVRHAFRSKHLRQAGYTEGAVVMAGTLLDLHGTEHRDRRRVENRLFRRDTFANWEHHVLGVTVNAAMQPFVDRGHGDLVQIGYRAAMNLTAQIAGIDIDPADESRTDQLFAIVKKLSEGATLKHSTRDKDIVRAEVADAIAQFQTEFYEPSFARRDDLLRGGAQEPDVLSTLLVGQDQLPLDAQVVFREICFYLQAGAHSTANAFVHTVNDLLCWAEANNTEPSTFGLPLIQRAMHESLRLHPASPVAYRTPLEDVELPDGTVLPKGSRVVLDLTAANTDPDVFGESAAHFDPNRVLPRGVPPWGMSFGSGMHACIGAELDGGLDPALGGDEAAHLFGTVAVIANAFLRAGGRADPDHVPTLDPNSTRTHFSSYPVVF
jgi:cytochrome P450